MSEHDRRNPFGIAENDDRFDQLLIDEISKKMGRSYSKQEALEWLAQWQHSHPTESESHCTRPTLSEHDYWREVATPSSLQTV